MSETDFQNLPEITAAEATEKGLTSIVNAEDAVPPPDV